MKSITTPALLFLFSLLVLPVGSLAAPPNLVVFLADDAGWGDFSWSGNRQVSTPNIDSIAKGGVSLDRFYVCSVCAPTRAEFLTGRYHPRGGVSGVSTGKERLDPDEKTIADAFHAAGYATGAFGKWHNGSQWPYHPMARGFDEYFGHTAGHWGEYFDAPLEENGRMVRTRGYIVDVCTDRALDFIDRNKANPFVCYVPFTTPHSPWTAPEKDWKRFKDKPITQRATDTKAEVDDHTRCALAMVENQDWNVGRVLDRLAEHGIDDNTIVVYFSDNGPNSHRWTGGMKGRKGTTDEGGLRSVCYIRWPAKLPAGHTVTPICGAIDLMPTLTSLAGVKRVGDKPLDGRDLTPLLMQPTADHQNTDWTEHRHFSHWANKVSVRTQTHRLDHQGNLFDMIADPGQTTPVNAQQPELAAELTAAVEAWRQEMFGTDAPAPRQPANKKRGGQSIDPRPFTVGYREFPITMLPARDGEPRGGVRRSSGAPNCSYFVDWTSTDDSMVWLIEVNTAGRYGVTIDYTCKVPDAGSTIQLSFSGSKLTGKVAPGWDSPLYTNQDTLERPKGESQMKEFRTLELGQIDLPTGTGPLTLRAIDIPGQSVMDVRRVTLTLLP
ncbi:sulfatase-like hydrolase/transferase [Stieleria sp. ICT_E10.1]|uniref:sulfatase-like hydrolase/transferase n=1 Tax=Stieleria sedimenti TaxID=2976331 RepID=UPI00218087D2|nr:sulfatase-like hydrolase/transferase [Stieleria sedimenti]MCS7468424.1 sulfatase-like hydrolase/transferase [Stieleria sedimenti]